MMTSEVDVPLSLLHIHRRSSNIASKLKKRKSKVKAKLVSESRKTIFCLSESNPDVVSKGSDESRIDIKIARKETPYFKQRTGVVYSTIRMISDVPTFVGGDGQNYTVKAGDIAVIPLDQAMVLYNRGMAVLMVDEA
jgi:hypothetical protein